MRKSIFFFVFLCMQNIAAQDHTLKWEPNTRSPEANLEQLTWLTGHWQGEAFGGIAEEIWSPPLGGSMMFVFRLVAENQVSFYEVGYIKETEGTLILQLKHFDSDLHGWEAQDETVDFRLIRMKGDQVYFDGLTMEKISDDEIHVYVMIESKDGEKETLFRYQRKKTAVGQ